MPDKGVDDIRRAMVAQIIHDMSKDGAEWTKSWRYDMPGNPVTGSKYRGRNALIVWFQMRERGIKDPRFVTYRQATEQGWQVRRGSKSILIEKWSQFVVDKRTNRRAKPQPKTPEEWAAADANPNLEVMLRPFGHWNVFSAEDIDGIGPYESKGGLAKAEVIDFLEAHSPCPVQEELGDRACYNRLSDSITVPLREQFSDEAAMASVILHEQAHATGSPDRLSREKGDAFGDEKYAFEELVAELSSLMSANELGIDLAAPDRGSDFDTSPYWQNHVAYLKGWSEALDTEDFEPTVMRAASKAAQATDWLVTECFAPGLAAEREAPSANESLLAQAAEAIAASERDASGAMRDARAVVPAERE